MERLKKLLSSESVSREFALALPQGTLSAARFARLAVTTLAKDEKLQKCSPESVLLCLLDVARMGLEPDGRLCHLVPYGTTCTLLLDYKGKVALLHRSGEVREIHSDVICENDDFLADRGHVIKHVTALKDRGEVLGAYTTFRLNSGGEQSTVMLLDEIISVRDMSQSWKSKGAASPWGQHFREMAKKTTFHRGSKLLDLSSEVREHFDKDDDFPQFKKARGREVSEPVLDDALPPPDAALPPPEVTEADREAAREAARQEAAFAPAAQPPPYAPPAHLQQGGAE